MGVAFEPGVRVSGHLLSEEIGRGGFSRVFRAEPVGGGEPVAIKVAVRSELLSALRAEGAVLRRLQGPRFVRIIEEHLDQDPPYFVLELCPGGDLRAKLERSPARRLPEGEARALMDAILEGMAFAHDEGFVHGDLKPDNILLDGRGEPKIADLGFSRSVRRKLIEADAALSASLGTEEGKVRGTFDYLGPEVRAGGELSPASDVFALGVLFYELLVGRRPLGAFQLPSAALAREGVKVPAWLDRVLARSLAHDTRDRYPDAALMLADLRAGEKGVELPGLDSLTNHEPSARRVKPINDAFFFAQITIASGIPIAIMGGTALAMECASSSWLLKAAVALACLFAPVLLTAVAVRVLLPRSAP